MIQLPLAQRHLQAEVMDRADLDVGLHHQALAGLGRLNRVSGVCRQLWRQIRKSAQPSRGTTLRVLDVASGGGDVPLGIWTLARRSGIELQIRGLDASLTACRFAARRCRAANGAITFERLDVTRQPLPSGFDVATCSLFLHHLTRAQAATLLQKMAAAVPLLLVSDLRRSAIGYALAHIACRTITQSPIVGVDGPQSVANAFSLAEMRELCQAAGLESATVRAAWPYRWMLVHNRPVRR